MASPITIALATECVENGDAEAVLLAIRAESVVRQQIAREELSHATYTTHPEAFHLWLTLPARWQRAPFAARLSERGIQAVTSDAFALGDDPPEALRVCLGGATSRDELRHVLSLIGGLLEETPG